MTDKPVNVTADPNKLRVTQKAAHTQTRSGVKTMTSDPIDVTADDPSAPPEKLKPHVQAINGAYDGVGDKIYETAMACARAQKELDEKGRGGLIKYLRFGKSKFSKFAAIGNRALLWTPEIRPFLPLDSMSSLYELTLLSDEAIIKMRDEGLLTPGCTREDILAYKAACVDGEPDDDKGPREAKKIQFGSIQIPVDLPLAKQEELGKELDKLRPRFRVTIVRQSDRYAKIAQNYLNKVDTYIINEARRLVEAKLNRGTYSKEQKKAFKTFDDVNMAQSNLHMIGLASSFPKIREEAHERVQVPALLIDMCHTAAEARSLRHACCSILPCLHRLPGR